MTIEKNISGGVINFALAGRLDTVTAPELESVLDDCIADASDLVFDLKELEYISSAGLRIILNAQKAMNAKGTMKLKNVSDAIMEVFDITGFADILTIE